MMISNAAFIPDPVPAGLPQAAVGTAAPLAAGTGIFQKLLQGMQGESTPATTASDGSETAKGAGNAAQAAGLADTGEGEESAIGNASLSAGLAAETDESAVVVSFPLSVNKAAAEPRLQPVLTYQGLKQAAGRGEVPAGASDPQNGGDVVTVAALTAKEAAVKESTEAASEETSVETRLPQEKAPQLAGENRPGAGAEAMQLAVSGAVSPATAAGDRVEAEPAASTPSRVETAAMRVEAGPAQRQSVTAEAGNPVQGTPVQGNQVQASQVQGKPVQDAAKELPSGARQRASADPEAGTPKADPGRVVASGADAGAKLGQKAEPAKVVLQVGQTEAKAPAGATERAQVEVQVHSPTAVKVAAGNDTPKGGFFTPMPLGGASFQAAPGLAKEAAANEATGRVQVVMTEVAPASLEAEPAGVRQEVSPQQLTAAEGAQAEVVETVPQAKAQVEPAAVKEQAAKSESAAGEIRQGTEKLQQKTDQKQEEESPTVTARELEAAPKPAATTAAGDDPAATEGTKPATATPQAGQGRGEQQAASQDGQGRNRHEGQAEHQAQAAGATFRAQEAAAAEPAQSNADAAGSRKALHENILSQVKDGVVTHDGKGNGQMSIRLNPGELGELKIQVRMDDNRLRVEVQADNRIVKDLLMSNLDSLKEALSGKNLAMDGFNVSTGGGGFNSPLHEEREQRRQSLARFAGGGGYRDEGQARVNYLTDATETLLDVRF